MAGWRTEMTIASIKQVSCALAVQVNSPLKNRDCNKFFGDKIKKCQKISFLGAKMIFTANVSYLIMFSFFPLGYLQLSHFVHCLHNFLHSCQKGGHQWLFHRGRWEFFEIPLLGHYRYAGGTAGGSQRHCRQVSGHGVKGVVPYNTAGLVNV